MTEHEARAVILAFPDVTQHPILGSVGFKTNGKVLCRIGARTGPDDLMFKGIGFDEAEHLMERYPRTFHTTPHYAQANCILARLATLDTDLLRTMLEHRWRTLARKADVKAWDAARAAP